ncbi:NAD-dependent epimerase/dehydratase family protein [Paeniglutamicibacter psychrophenolicus]|uniref:NAD-dependent epimerase/dehydratase family protein n=1 Tax=Paeniglutamicibacter psychrophenolicus TaxID=257454 RepID=UPI00278B63B3|nr:NAD-dependent epimerase/dehydratase family protein [Paeniglutamicibacter psychrophenolicus]MDQ0096244.1 nucleoside-diphosphate-sugar epimerase [Paeniglutamicibacter psychrophenolicus]
MKILVIGAGDLGTEAGLRFIAAGHRVTAWRRRPELLPASFGTRRVDLGDAGTELPTIDADTDIVVFTPAAPERSEDAYRRTYLSAARRVFDALARDGVDPQRFLLVSSTAVYGDAAGGWVDEDTPASPRTATARILAQTEALVRERASATIVLRLAGIYGPGRNHLITQVRNGAARAPGKTVWTNRIHRDDAASAIVHLCSAVPAPDPLYLGVDLEPVDLAEVQRFIAALLDVSAPGPGDAPVNRGGDRRLSNARLLATGFRFAFPTYREGYASVLSGEGARHP